MRSLPGARVVVVGELVSALVVFCLLAGVAIGCGGEEDPSRADGPALEGSVPAGEPEGKLDRPSRQSDRTPPAKGRRAEPEGSGGSRSGAKTGSIPPGLVESRLAGIAAGLPGRVGMMVTAPGGPGPQLLFGDLAAGPAWSTINLPVAERVLDDGEGPSGIDERARTQIEAAITRPDSDAGTALFSRLASTHRGPAGASRAIEETLRAAGGESPVISARGPDGPSGIGQGEWSLAAQSRYMAALAGGCVSDKASRRFLLAKMAPAAERDAFGLGSIGERARWISGWGVGPGGKALARQIGVIDTGGGPIVVALAALPADGSLDTGKAMLNELADRLASRFAGQALRERPCPLG